MLALDIENLTVAFPGLSSPALAIGRLSIDAGSRVAITGASGSGKSTFVNIVAGLERTRQGRICWNGEDIASFSESRRDRFRAANIGWSCRSSIFSRPVGAGERTPAGAACRRCHS